MPMNNPSENKHGPSQVKEHVLDSSVLTPRDVVKLAFQHHEYSEIPFTINTLTPEQEAGLLAHYGDERWRQWIRPYIRDISGVDTFLSRFGNEQTPEGYCRDAFGSVWDLRNILHLVEPPLREPSLKGYCFPDIDEYYAKHLRPLWGPQIENSANSFRTCSHMFALFERAWTLRGFETFLVDLYDHPAFCEELLEAITDWLLQAIDNMFTAPVDAIVLTDDYADQRGVIFGLERFQKFFKPCWKRIFARIRKGGAFSILHVCGCAAPAVPDLIECGLDCLESLQPEAMDIYKLKREYGKDICLWGGLGAQSILPFGSSDDVRQEIRRLKKELGKGGGYILAGTKGIDADVPVANVVAYLEEARTAPMGDAGSSMARTLHQIQRFDQEMGLFSAGFKEKLKEFENSMRANDGLPYRLTVFECSDLQPASADVRAVAEPPRDLAFSPVKTATFDGNFCNVCSFHGGRNGLLYICARLDVGRPGPGKFLYGSDGPVKVWVNGREAGCQPTATNPGIADRYQAEVEWTRGENTIVFALATNSGKAWGVFAAAIFG